MTGTVAISLLSSLTLFLGLTALARQRIRREKLGVGSLVFSLLGLCGAVWLSTAGDFHFAAPAVLIGLLGYCFGHFTTQRPAPRSDQAGLPAPQNEPS